LNKLGIFFLDLYFLVTQLKLSGYKAFIFVWQEAHKIRIIDVP